MKMDFSVLSVFPPLHSDPATPLEFGDRMVYMCWCWKTVNRVLEFRSHLRIYKVKKRKKKKKWNSLPEAMVSREQRKNLLWTCNVLGLYPGPTSYIVAWPWPVGALIYTFVKIGRL